MRTTQRRNSRSQRGCADGDERARCAAFGARLSQLLRDRRITASSIARDLEVTRGAVSNWTNGLRFPSGRHQVELAKLLSVSLDELNAIRRSRSKAVAS